MAAENGDGIALTDVTGAVRRHWAVLVLGVLVGLLVGAAYFAAAPRAYSAGATVTVSAIDDPSDSGSAEPPSMATERAVVSSGAVAREAARALGRPGSASELTENLTVTSPQDSQVLVITYQAATGRAAAKAANAFAKSYLKYRGDEAEQQYTAASKNVESQLAKLRKKLGKVEQRIDGGSQPSSATVERDQLFTQISQLRSEATRLATHVADPGAVVDRASPPASPSSPRLAVAGAAGLVLGVLLAAALVVWRELANSRLKGRQDVERHLRRPVLAVVTSGAGNGSDRGYRVAAAKLLGDVPPRSIVVTAANEGVACTAARRVIRSLTALDTAATLVEASPANGIHVPVPDNADVVARQPSASALRELEERGQGVIVTAMPWHSLPELLLVARAADLVVPIAVADDDRQADVRRPLADLDQVGATIPGVLLVEPGAEYDVVTQEQAQEETEDALS
ncbi:MAG: hypothetical protein ACRDMV_16340 [Streptosporangiales bacterium]